MLTQSTEATNSSPGVDKTQVGENGPHRQACTREGVQTHRRAYLPDRGHAASGRGRSAGRRAGRCRPGRRPVVRVPRHRAGRPYGLRRRCRVSLKRSARPARAEHLFREGGRHDASQPGRRHRPGVVAPNARDDPITPGPWKRSSPAARDHPVAPLLPSSRPRWSLSANNRRREARATTYGSATARPGTGRCGTVISPPRRTTKQTTYRRSLVSGSLNRVSRQALDAPGFSALRCWGGFELPEALPDDGAGRGWS